MTEEPKKSVEWLITYQAGPDQYGFIVNSHTLPRAPYSSVQRRVLIKGTVKLTLPTFVIVQCIESSSHDSMPFDYYIPVHQIIDMRRTELSLVNKIRIDDEPECTSTACSHDEPTPSRHLEFGD